MKSILAALGVLALAASASAATLKVPQQYDTIQEAVNAAEEGDTIVVSKGVYFESVGVSTTGLTITGKKAILDGSYNGGALVTAGASYNTCMNVYSSGVTIQGFTFRNGENHINIYGQDTRLLKCISRNAGYDAVTVNSANGCEISGNRFIGPGYAGIYMQAGTGLIAKNEIRQAGSYGIQAYGGSLVITGNTIGSTAGNYGIYASGSGMTVSANKVSRVGSDGINVNGNDNTVSLNRVSWCSGNTGIYANGSGLTVSGNTVSVASSLVVVYGNGNDILDNKVSAGLNGSGITVGGDAFNVTGNLVQQVSEYGSGFYLYNSSSVGGSSVANNTAEDTSGNGFYFNAMYNGAVSACKAVRCGDMGYYAGFSIYGSGMTFTSCVATDCHGDGFLVNALDSTFNLCASVDASINGFQVQGSGNEFTSCIAKGTGGQGFHNSGPGTKVTGGSYTNNRIDIANDLDSGGTFSGGLVGVVFDSGGATTLPEVFYYIIW